MRMLVEHSCARRGGGDSDVRWGGRDYSDDDSGVRWPAWMWKSGKLMLSMSSWGWWCVWRPDLKWRQFFVSTPTTVCMIAKWLFLLVCGWRKNGMDFDDWSGLIADLILQNSEWEAGGCRTWSHMSGERWMCCGGGGEKTVFPVDESIDTAVTAAAAAGVWMIFKK